MADAGAAEALPIRLRDAALIAHHQGDHHRPITRIGQGGEDMPPHRGTPALDLETEAGIGFADQRIARAFAGLHGARGADVVGEHRVFAVEAAGIHQAVRPLEPQRQLPALAGLQVGDAGTAIGDRPTLPPPFVPVALAIP